MVVVELVGDVGGTGPEDKNINKNFGEFGPYLRVAGLCPGATFISSPSWFNTLAQLVDEACLMIE